MGVYGINQGDLALNSGNYDLSYHQGDLALNSGNYDLSYQGNNLTITKACRSEPDLPGQRPEER